jgi:hypothetical protein
MKKTNPMKNFIEQSSALKIENYEKNIYPTVDKKISNEEEEIYDLIKSSALLKGLDVSKSNWKIKPIAQ